MHNLRRLTPAGIEKFYQFLEKTWLSEKQTKTKLVFNDEVVTSNLYSEKVEGDCLLDRNKVFENRYELASYILKNMKPMLVDFNNTSDDLYKDYGLWAWIAAFYFSQLRGNITRRTEHYIPDEYKPKTYTSLHYRHCIRYPVLLLNNKEVSDDFCKFLMTGRQVYELGDPFESCCSRKHFIKSKIIRDTLLELYQDKTTKTVKAKAFIDQGWSF